MTLPSASVSIILCLRRIAIQLEAVTLRLDSVMVINLPIVSSSPSLSKSMRSVTHPEGRGRDVVAVVPEIGNKRSVTLPRNSSNPKFKEGQGQAQEIKSLWEVLTTI